MVENPRQFPHSELSPYRKAVVSRFPFCIYYSVIQDLIVVFAIHDARRDPARWQQRTKP
jgi:hypothetical protein